MKEKIKILTDLGFVPMVEGEGNTLFRMNDVVMSVSDPNQTPEQLKKEVMSLIKNRDIAERGGQVPVVAEDDIIAPIRAQRKVTTTTVRRAQPEPLSVPQVTTHGKYCTVIGSCPQVLVIIIISL